jgi:hypothetical protein
MSWKLAASLAVFATTVAYLVAKLWRPFDAEGKPYPLRRPKGSGS